MRKANACIFLAGGRIVYVPELLLICDRIFNALYLQARGFHKRIKRACRAGGAGFQASSPCPQERIDTHCCTCKGGRRPADQPARAWDRGMPRGGGKGGFILLCRAWRFWRACGATSSRSRVLLKVRGDGSEASKLWRVERCRRRERNPTSASPCPRELVRKAERCDVERSVRKRWREGQ